MLQAIATDAILGTRPKPVDKNQLIPGQHIFAYRALGSYSHHGIYVGRDSKKWHVQYVIHFMITGAAKSGSSSTNSQKCEDCNYRTNVDDGVVRTCLNCFMSNGGLLGGTELYLYHYGVSFIDKLDSVGGTCSCQPAKPLEEIVKTAYERLNNPKSRSYDLLTYNCETFATECSTGRGESGQVFNVATVSLRTSPLFMLLTTANRFKRLLER